jgi:hypothetical protein
MKARNRPAPPEPGRSSIGVGVRSRLCSVAHSSYDWMGYPMPTTISDPKRRVAAESAARPKVRFASRT